MVVCFFRLFILVGNERLFVCVCSGILRRDQLTNASLIQIWRLGHPLSKKLGLLLKTFICSCIHVMVRCFGSRDHHNMCSMSRQLKLRQRVRTPNFRTAHLSPCFRTAHLSPCVVGHLRPFDHSAVSPVAAGALAIVRAEYAPHALQDARVLSSNHAMHRVSYTERVDVLAWRMYAFCHLQIKVWAVSCMHLQYACLCRLASFQNDSTNAPFQEQVQFVLLFFMVALTRIVAVMLVRSFGSLLAWRIHAWVQPCLLITLCRKWITLCRKWMPCV